MNDKRHGKGKIYYDNGKISFDGIFFNGQSDGKGKEYYKNGKLRFDGEYLYDHKIRGKLYLNEKLE